MSSWNPLWGRAVGLTSLLFAAQAHSSSGAVTRSTTTIDNPAPGWDHLWFEVIVDITIIGVIFSLMTLYFIFKYRRRDPDEEGSQPKLTPAMAVGWALIPAFIFMADDFFLAAKGWQLWNDYRQVPADRMEIQLESGMYSWDYTYPNGVQTQNELRVPAGKPIMLRMTSRDTLHSHYIPDFRVKEDSMPGRITYLWFYPEVPGEHLVTCTEYCGIMHSYMVGKVIAMPKPEFEKWYNDEAAKLAQNNKSKPVKKEV
jgi:cytochrome c oxidase subunit II